MSNGATLTMFARPEAGGPAVLIVAGQHGNETGPIEALRGGLHPRHTMGIRAVGVVPIANPRGYALGDRYAGPNRRDLNRLWGTGDEVTDGLWSAFVGVAGEPDIVIDLHSARAPWSGMRTPHRLDYGRLAMAADERSAVLAREAAALMGEVESGWASKVHPHPEGSLGYMAVAHGAMAVTVEFDESCPSSQTVGGLPMRHSGRLRDSGRRGKTAYERTIGIREVVEGLLAAAGSSQWRHALARAC